jgi:hypothetical protein
VNPELPLKDIHLPEAVGWWPPAPGWWLLLVFMLLAGLWVFRWYRGRQQQQAFQKSIERELQEASLAYQQHQDSRRLVQDLSILLRRVAMSVTSRHEIAGQIGERWLQQLDELADTQLFTSDTGRQLITAPYQPQAEIDADGLLQLCQQGLQRIYQRRGEHAHV